MMEINCILLQPLDSAFVLCFALGNCLAQLSYNLTVLPDALDTIVIEAKEILDIIPEALNAFSHGAGGLVLRWRR